MMLGDVTLQPGEEGWYPVAAIHELKAERPLQRWLFGVPLAVFGTAERPAVLIDRCPHRSAPLSAGKIVDGRIQCPYHGWAFDGTGLCRKIPCLPGEPPKRKAASLPALARYGLVFARVGLGAAEPPAPVLAGARGHVHIWCGLEVKGSLADVAENFLDATHTIVVHPRMIRGTAADTEATVSITGKPGEVEITYAGEGRPSGIVSRLLEGARSSSVGRFRGPNVTDVEFHGARGIRFGITSYLVPSRPGMVGGHAIVTVPGHPWLARLKFLLLYPFARLVNRQDMRILNLVDDNHAQFGRPKHSRAPTDFVAADIAAILAGELPPAAAVVRKLRALL